MDLQKEREAFEAVTNIYHCIYNADLNYYFSGSQFVGNKAEIAVNAGWKAWQAAKAQAVAEGFVLIKDDTKTVVAIERMVEQQVEASGMDSRRLERLDGWKIIEAAVKAQEPAK